MSTRPPTQPGWTRRDVFNWILNGVMGLIALVVAIPVVGAALTPAFVKSRSQWVRLGSADALKAASLAAGHNGIGGVTKSPYSYIAVDHWARRPVSDYTYTRYIGGACAFFILSPICTHLGCHVDWIPADNQFHCPCHGSVYTIDGLNVSGPAPLPLGVFRWKQVGPDIFIAVESTFTHAVERPRNGPAQPCLKVT
jgi:menaquinol-cytochrome c reductase iron-sulfur subunit